MVPQYCNPEWQITRLQYTSMVSFDWRSEKCGWEIWLYNLQVVNPKQVYLHFLTYMFKQPCLAKSNLVIRRFRDEFPWSHCFNIWKNGRTHEPEATQSYETLSSMMIPTCFIHSAPKQWLPSWTNLLWAVSSTLPPGSSPRELPAVNGL